MKKIEEKTFSLKEEEKKDFKKVCCMGVTDVAAVGRKKILNYPKP
jgi:hypothetical protein